MQNPTYINDHAAVFLPPNYHEKISCQDGIGGDCMQSELSRRILANAGYISYGALQRDSIPCNVRGNSYYNCHSNQQANPYSRSCTKITYCARNNH
ncbi:ralf-like 33 [Perilla frutescens var. hirtella]|uniref:Ralf-like 33 n=1 Tax=Perilla frutescens var. hirtella TaxID=608512 RepID=A0AAD4JI84_PERFH|nr:hypothetical protein C2S51_037990 [Perilla frutescens var. frutescens]KAH6833901.1 ralf-like 33 [Perilla frutescens var. hirtella]